MYSGPTGEFVISANQVYDAWSGELVYYLPYASTWQGAAVSTSLGVLLTHHGSNVYAYDLAGGSFQLLWSLDVGFDGEVWLTCRDQVFYVSGYHPDGNDRVWGIAAIEGGALKWKKLEADLGIGHYWDVRMPAVTGSAIFVALSWGSGNPLPPDGAIALDPANGTVLWTRLLGEEVCALSVDEGLGLVFSGPRWAAMAYRAANGELAWEAPIENIALNPPTLGWVRQGGTDVRAVFTAAGSDTGAIYAHSAADGALLWYSDQLPGTWTSATYSGAPGNGKLYVGAVDGRTYVLDADTGDELQILATHGQWGANAVPAIVEVIDDGGVSHSVMYYLQTGGTVAAWSQSGQNPPPQAFRLTIAADPGQIAPFSDSLVTATLVDAHLQPVSGATVSFSCDARKNQGLIVPLSDVTDANGEAHTVYFSDRREGLVTITASAPGFGSDSVDITIVKGGGGDPPPAELGTITGTVRIDGKPARKVNVVLTGPLTDAMTTNGKGTYSFTELPFGDYEVEVPDRKSVV